MVTAKFRSGMGGGGGGFNTNMTSYRNRNPHCGDKTILRPSFPSYLQNVIDCTGKTTSLYWTRAQVVTDIILRVWKLAILWWDVLVNIEGALQVIRCDAWKSMRCYLPVYTLKAFLFNSSRYKDCIYGLVQDCSNPSALEMELLHSCTKPWTWT